MNLETARSIIPHRPLTVDVATVAQPQHDDCIVVDVEYDAVFADPKTPGADSGVRQFPRITEWGIGIFLEFRHNTPPGYFIHLLEIMQGPCSQYDLKHQECLPVA